MGGKIEICDSNKKGKEEIGLLSLEGEWEGGL